MQHVEEAVTIRLVNNPTVDVLTAGSAFIHDCLTARSTIAGDDVDKMLVGVAVIALVSPVVTLSLVPWLNAAIMGGCAAGFAVGATRALLGDRGDVGHRITCVSLLWLLVACGQVGLSASLGSDIVLMLPVLAVPLVAVVAWMNAGAGLSVPVRSSAS